MLAKSLISFVLSILFASLFSIDKIARSSSLPCDIVDLRYVFISFNIENDLSADATVIGKVMKGINSLYISGNEELMRLWSMRLLTSRTVSVTAISFLNSVANDLISESNSSIKSFGYFSRIARVGRGPLVYELRCPKLCYATVQMPIH